MIGRIHQCGSNFIFWGIKLPFWGLSKLVSQPGICSLTSMKDFSVCIWLNKSKENRIFEIPDRSGNTPHFNKLGLVLKGMWFKLECSTFTGNYILSNLTGHSGDGKNKSHTTFTPTNTPIDTKLSTSLEVITFRGKYSLGFKRRQACLQ